MSTLWTTALTLAVAACCATAQTEPIELPQPTGHHPVATITYQWERHDRRFSYSSFAGDFRRIIVQLWYPASTDKKASTAPYSPLAPEYRHVKTHSRLRTAFARDLLGCPLVLISPGRGTERFGYTTIAEALASRGYVVASVDMPGIGYVSYPDGVTVQPDTAFRPSRELMAGPYEQVDAFFEKPTEIGRLDLELVFEKILELNAQDPTGRFVGRIDVDNVGVFGHSLGGRLAGAFAEKNSAVKAYAAMEGIAPRRARVNGLPMPVAMLCSSKTLPYAKDNYQGLIDGRREVVFMVELQKFGHNSVTDFPLVTPTRFNYEIEPRPALMITVSIIQAFFDAFLKRNGRSFPERCAALDGLIISTFEPMEKK